MRRTLGLGAIGASALAVSALVPRSAALAQTLTPLYSFQGAANTGPDGADPASLLVYHGGALYGSTVQGGPAGLGTVFKIDTATGAETVLHGFTGGADAMFPNGVTYANGALYGTSVYGGNTQICTDGCGTIFKIDLKTGTESVLYQFSAYGDGWAPEGGLMSQAKILYGTTSFGGTDGAGTVFKFDPAKATKTLVYSFAGGATDSAEPEGSLLFHKGAIYGTSYSGGPRGFGTAWKINVASAAEKVLHFFGASETDGIRPTAGLIYQGGALYGTTNEGGAQQYSAGSVFSIDPSSGAETILHAFLEFSGDGTFPNSSLTYQAGTLYGTTTQGGTTEACPSGCGTVFGVNPQSGAESVVYDFSGRSDGGNPEAGMIAKKNALYGTTSVGGAAIYGTVFKFVP